MTWLAVAFIGWCAVCVLILAFLSARRPRP